MRAPATREMRAVVGPVSAGPAASAARRVLTAAAGRRLLADRVIRATIAVTALAFVWYAVGPGEPQLLGFRVVTPALAGLIAIAQWQVGRDTRLSAESTRFWRILSLGMFTYMAGMVVDLGVLICGRVTGIWLPYAGEILLYPTAGVLSIVALVVFPTSAQNAMGRIKLGLDVATVLFGSATFVWYFLAAREWQPANGWQLLSLILILPALTLVAAFAILRIAMAGDNVLTRPTAALYIFGALTSVVSVSLHAPAASLPGRLESAVLTLGMAGCVVGAVLQRQAEPPQQPTPRIWRRSFTALPYAALSATVGLLLVVIAADLDYRGWVVAVGMLTLCAVVLARQLVSLWENSRLLTANQDLTGRLRHQAYYDHLTGLANRTLFTHQVSETLAGAGPDARVAVLFVDLDDFKIVNDSLGHQAGDELLVAVADRLRETLPAGDMLGRLGGDEFAILIADAAGQHLPTVAERIIAALSIPFLLQDMQVRIEASVGIAIASSAGSSSTELLRNADVAMYTAKNTRKGGWRIFEPEMLAGLLHRHQQRAALVQAAERNEFIVYYQPIVDLTDGALHGAEALVRWRQRGGRIVMPNQFIPLAEETGLIAEIDRQVLLQACRQAAHWRAGPAAGTGFALHANISARQLHRADLVMDVECALHDSGLPAESLTLEITESGLGQNHEAALQRLAALRQLGVHLAIDDFGTGYSSLAYLRHMPVDTLKIDKTFTDELLDETVTAPLAQVVIALASALGMQTVAEGIEDPQQAHRLLAFGCQLGQGFHYSTPLTADQMNDLVGGAARQLSGTAGHHTG